MLALNYLKELPHISFQHPIWLARVMKDKDIKQLNDLNYKLTRWTADFDGEKLSDIKKVCEKKHYADGVFSDENDLRSKANSSLDFNNHTKNRADLHT